MPDEFTWARLVILGGDDLEVQYRHTLEALSKQGGTCLKMPACAPGAGKNLRWQVLGTIFRKAQKSIKA